eukprot:6762361-Alexandrium_andersonii.AAC.1
MSASLVGSEMCIRDRHLVPGRGAPPGWAAWRQRPRPHLPARPRRDLQPVSYTHLTLPTICSV